MKKIAFLGYDFFHSCLEKLIQDGHQVKWLFTFDCDNKVNFNSKVIASASQQGAEIINRRINKNDIQLLTEKGCDLIISAAYPFLIPVIEGMPRTINIHPSLLPTGRGPWPLPIVILKELPKTGITIHKVAREFDSGDILIQRSFPVTKDENLETLSCKSQIMAPILLTELLSDFDNFWENARPQNEGEYWPAPTFEERQLNWDLSIKTIDKVARAFGKFDSLATFDSKDWVAQDLSVWYENHTFVPGNVVHRTNREVVIAARDGLVCIRFFSIDPDFEEPQ